MIEKLVKRNKIYNGSIIDVFCDKVKLSNGFITSREYLSHPGAAAVLPFLDKKNIVLVKQYRYPINQITYEIPAGKIDKSENPFECALRELEEETGYKVKKMKKLLLFHPTVAFSTELIYIYVAFGLEKGMKKTDNDEFVEQKVLNFNSAIKMVKSGKITDAKTIIALLYMENILKRS
ncbi:MAG: NUDIX hydrolase [Endomicrobium sp.]|nr:NUDIX hydrolase [Endomicrobium sp.]